MGFPGDETGWASVVEGAIFPGAGGSMPGTWTVIGIIACIVVLVIGQMSESSKYKK